ncbi:MAG: DNA mismatch repair endonuclease MutL [Prevotella sp.]
MSDIIQLLPDAVANQIAAGEVIQRPASVIKELVENAVDASATAIDVLVVDAGRTSIQVVDNGKGMSQTDARLAFERHATSKIREAKDLFALHTMGFRGEALASIAAVAQVVLKTRQEKDEIGTLLSISGSRFVAQEPCSVPVGSSFFVDNLFFNVPARRKFLKSNATELNNIMSAFERIVLVNPGIAFTFKSNGTELYNLKATNIRQRIVDVFGKKINQELLPLNVETSICKVSGFVGKPESAKKKNANQFFFVNGRYMKHPYFHKAVMSAFERLVPVGEQVPYFIYFDVEPESIDVNIHPTKTEIKFENEQAVWQVLSATVKEAVGLFSDIPSIDFDTQGKPDIPVFKPGETFSLPKVEYNASYNPFDTPSGQRVNPASSWEELYQGCNENSPAKELFETETEKTPSVQDMAPSHYQFKGRYIITAIKSGLLVIDQHRAHMRILYEQYMDSLEHEKAYSQKMLFPEIVRFTPSEETLLPLLVPQLEKIGFSITSLGDNSYRIGAVPSGLDGLDYVELIHDMLLSAEGHQHEPVGQIRQAMSLVMAQKAAIPYGQVLSNEEMENIVNALFACQNTNYLPDGRKILAVLEQSQLESLFC